MKNTSKIALLLALVLCLSVSFAACKDNDEYIIYLTDTAGETVTDTDGEPVTETKSAETTSDTESSSNQSNIQNSGANTESGWGPLIPPN